MYIFDLPNIMANPKCFSAGDGLLLCYLYLEFIFLFL